MATCRNTSRISSRVTPLLSAPLTCTFSSCGRLSALIIARLIRLRVLSGSPSRPQHHPQQYLVANSCIGMLKSSAVLNAFSTNSFPRTALRISSPLSNVVLSMLCSCPKHLRPPVHQHLRPLVHSTSVPQYQER